MLKKNYNYSIRYSLFQTWNLRFQTTILKLINTITRCGGRRGRNDVTISYLHCSPRQPEVHCLVSGWLTFCFPHSKQGWSVSSRLHVQFAFRLWKRRSFAAAVLWFSTLLKHKVISQSWGYWSPIWCYMPLWSIVSDVNRRFYRKKSLTLQIIKCFINLFILINRSRLPQSFVDLNSNLTDWKMEFGFGGTFKARRHCGMLLALAVVGILVWTPAVSGEKIYRAVDDTGRQSYPRYCNDWANFEVKKGCRLYRTDPAEFWKRFDRIAQTENVPSLTILLCKSAWKKTMEDCCTTSCSFRCGEGEFSGIFRKNLGEASIEHQNGTGYQYGNAPPVKCPAGSGSVKLRHGIGLLLIGITHFLFW